MSFYGLKPLALTSDMPESQGTPSRGGKGQGSMGHKLSRADYVKATEEKATHEEAHEIKQKS